jgi:hypothetical protein
MTIRWSTDADRQRMREEKEASAEERRVLDELDRQTCREDPITPIMPGQMQVMNGLRRIDPNRRK